MSNKPPKINPLGTKFRNVRMYIAWPSACFEDRSRHTKPFTHCLSVVAEYIRAEYNVRCWEDPPGYMNADLTPPESQNA